MAPDEEDFSSTPYTEFGEFNDEDVEAQETRFFMYGRHFAISIGSGLMQVSGNRGAVYQGGFPSIDFRFHFWFDFHSALDFGFAQSTFNYSLNSQRTDVSITNVGLHYKRYLNTTDMSSGVSFANPYFLVGFGSYTQREVNVAANTSNPSDTQVAPILGGGLEFIL